MSQDRPAYLRQHRVTTVKLTIFVVVMVLIFGALAVVFSQVTFTSTKGYHAVFSEASGMTSGGKVRIAGVPVGRVTGVHVGRDNLAHVDFNVESRYQLLQSTRATIRYENLVGDRYVELLEGAGSGVRLNPGGTIPISRTTPALDLDELLGGFKPLLRGLDAKQANSLTAALIQVFQGQGGTLVSLLSSTGEFSKSLADRDAVIGGVINNLNKVLGTIAAKGHQFDTTVDQLQQLISGLAADRDPIGDAIPRLAGATGSLAALLQGTRPDLSATVHQLDRAASNLNAGQDKTQWVLDNLPDTYRKLARVGVYGAFLQLYVCKVQLKFTGPDGKPVMVSPLPGSDQTTGRCEP